MALAHYYTVAPRVLNLSISIYFALIDIISTSSRQIDIYLITNQSVFIGIPDFTEMAHRANLLALICTFGPMYIVFQYLNLPNSWFVFLQ
jgi:hypothetical protein